MSDILLNEQDGHVAGLDDLTIPITQDTQTNQDLDVKVGASRGNKGTRWSKIFHWKEDEVVCSRWLNASKDPINKANQTRTTF